MILLEDILANTIHNPTRSYIALFVTYNGVLHDFLFPCIVQHHIYPCISSDPGEEKLDASELQKDWDLQNSCPVELLAPPEDEEKNCTTSHPSGDKSKNRNKEKRSTVSIDNIHQ